MLTHSFYHRFLLLLGAITFPASLLIMLGSLSLSDGFIVTKISGCVMLCSASWFYMVIREISTEALILLIHTDYSAMANADKIAYFAKCALAVKFANVNDLINATDNNTLLTLAADQGNYYLVELLIKHGANVHYVSTCKRTALIFAAENNHVAIVELLIKHGADINHGGSLQRNALIYATTSGHVETVELLLKHGADINYADHFQETALSCAARNGYLELVSLLISNNANIADIHKVQPLIAAASNGHREIIALLIANGAMVNPVAEREVNALISAAAAGHDEVVAYLIDNGARIDYINESGETALICAAAGGHEHTVKLLIDNQADVNHIDDSRLFLTIWGSGKSALTHAAENGHVAVARLLIEQGARIDHIDELGGNALIYAVCKGFSDMVQLLIANQADVNYINKHNKSVLITAVERGHYAIVDLLLRNGAIVDDNIENIISSCVHCGYHTRYLARLAKQANDSVINNTLAALDNDDCFALYQGRMLRHGYGGKLDSIVNSHGNSKIARELAKWLKTGTSDKLNAICNDIYIAATNGNLVTPLDLLLTQQFTDHSFNQQQLDASLHKTLKFYATQGIYLGQNSQELLSSWLKNDHSLLVGLECQEEQVQELAESLAQDCEAIFRQFLSVEPQGENSLYAVMTTYYAAIGNSERQEKMSACLATSTLLSDLVYIANEALLERNLLAFLQYDTYGQVVEALDTLLDMPLPQQLYQIITQTRLMHNIRQLLQQGVAIDKVRGDNKTLLMEAAGKGQIKVVEFLVQQGADVNLIVKAETALSIAVKAGFTDVVEFLRKNSAIVFDSLDNNILTNTAWIHGNLRIR
jgi:ankyrin repeat protein